MAEPSATESLIDSLARGVSPVRRLRPPVARALAWIALAVLVIAALTAWPLSPL